MNTTLPTAPSFQGGAGHTSGWISPLPIEWQATLGGTHITGQSSGIPIISRTSVGPSAFAFNELDVVNGGSVPDPIATVTLLDFSLTHPLHDDLSNTSGTNHLWTHLSRVVWVIFMTTEMSMALIYRWLPAKSADHKHSNKDRRQNFTALDTNVLTVLGYIAFPLPE